MFAESNPGPMGAHTTVCTVRITSHGLTSQPAFRSSKHGQGRKLIDAYPFQTEYCVGAAATVSLSVLLALCLCLESIATPSIAQPERSIRRQSFEHRQ